MSKTSAEPISVIAITSLVAGSAVGGMVTSAVMQARGVKLALAPTVLMGRHPGKGDPGGGPVAAAQLSGVLTGLREDGWADRASAILLGYVSTPDQVDVAARFVAEARAVNPELFVLLDPILGDGPGEPDEARLYVRPKTADAVRAQLLPLADATTPNLFELAWLSDRRLETEAEIVEAARALGPDVIVTSAPAPPGLIGVMTIDALTASHLATPRREGAPNGAGDLFAAEALAAILNGETPGQAAAEAAARVGAVFAASDPAAGELSVTQAALAQPVHRPSARRVGATRPAFAMGVDGCPAGWCAVSVDMNGIEDPRVEIYADFTSLLGAGAQVIAVDMPIGFAERPGPAGMRQCEREARAILGPRRSSIFPSPLRPALAADDYRQALALNRAAGGKGLSKQAYNLFPKLREIDAVMTPEKESFLFETHPETSFTLISGAPAAHSKKTAAGRAERLAVLERHGLPTGLFEPHPFKRAAAAPDDIVDAGLCALTALRIAAGNAASLPADPPRDGRGLRMAIFA